MGSAKKGEKKLVVLVAVFLLYLLFISRQILTQSPKSKREVLTSVFSINLVLLLHSFPYSLVQVLNMCCIQL